MKLETLLRIFIQLNVMLGDILTIGFFAILLYFDPLNPFVWVILVLIFRAWHKQGGFMAWYPKNIKMFLKGDR